MPVWLAPIAKYGILGVLALLGAAWAIWRLRRLIETRKDAEAKAADAKLRAEAAKASQEGYFAEREKQKKVDIITGKPRPPSRVQ